MVSEGKDVLTMEKLKTCAWCKESKEVSQFTKCRGNKDGLFSYCRSCKSTKAKQSRERNSERIKTYAYNYNRNMPQKVKDKKRARDKKWYEKNKERIAKATRKRYEKNRDEILRKGRERYQRNKQRLKGVRKKWEQNNKAVRREITTRRRTRKLNNGIFKVTNKELNKMLNSLCYICQEAKCEHIDHIIPISKGGTHSIGNLAPSCKSCNLRKGAKLLIEVRTN